MGVPVEISSRDQLAQEPVCKMKGNGTHGMPTGTWSDDTSMEIALMQSLIDCQAFDYTDIMENFCRWSENGEFTATGVTFDIGGTCAWALGNFRRGVEPLECGGRDEHSNGNGSLMRILPVAFVCYNQDINGKARYELVKKVSSLTHAHPVSVMGCLIYTDIVVYLLEGNLPGEAYTKVRAEDYSMFSDEVREKYHRVLEDKIAAFGEDEISSSGYVVGSLEASLWCLLNTDNYKDAVLKAVNLDNDTDTIGAITGSMAGIYYGYENIPAGWIRKLKRHDYLLELCDTFAQTDITV